MPELVANSDVTKIAFGFMAIVFAVGFIRECFKNDDK